MSQRSFRRAHQRRLAAESRRESLRLRRTGMATFTALAATAGLAPAAGAATFVVNSNGDGPVSGACATADAPDCTLRDAIDQANTSPGADSITFQSSVTGTIDLTDGVIPIDSTDPLTITGPGQDVLSVSGGDGTTGSQIFDITGTGNVDISALKLTHGYTSGEGGAIVTGQVTGGVFKYGQLPSSSGPALSLTDVTISDSTAKANGGGIYSRGPLTLDGTTLTGNHGQTGGAVFDTANTTITSSTISGNTASSDAGGVYQRGKYFFDSGQQATISHSHLTGNTAQGNGGAFESSNSGVTISDSTFSGNSGVQGGAIHMGLGSMDISTSTISGNTASQNGGGVAQDKTGNKYPATPAFTVTDTTVSGNTATGSGGGIYAADAQTSVRGSTLSGNTAASGGGLFSSYSNGNAIYLDRQAAAAEAGVPAAKVAGLATPSVLVSASPSLLLENSTVYGNTANYGAGVGLDGQPSATLRGSTIDGNHAHVNGGGLSAINNAHPSIEDSILADNPFAAPGDQPQAGPDVFTDGSSDVTAAFSLIKDVSGATFASGGEDAVTQGNVGQSPQLGKLADNGGPTQTMKPGGTSPAIDTGSLFGMTADQRGVSRPQLAGPDIGAVELRIAPPLATTGDADHVTDSAATLHGTINVRGAGSYHFEYGTSANYGASTATVTAPSDTADHPETADLTGLAPNTTYHFRVVATNDENTTNGEDRTFTTSAAQVAPPPPPALQPPSVTNLTVNHRCVTSATLQNPSSGTGGLSFGFDLSQDATVRYEIFRRNPSPKWRTCPKPGGTVPVTFSSVWSSSDQENSGSKSTTLASTSSAHKRRVGRLAVRKGHRRLTLSRLVSGQKLKWGSYLLRITASNAAGPAPHAAVIQFWVLGPWAKSSGHGRKR